MDAKREKKSNSSNWVLSANSSLCRMSVVYDFNVGEGLMYEKSSSTCDVSTCCGFQAQLPP